jgi:dipeptidyl aminopeptidase/acylaminoacyl peptidase
VAGFLFSASLVAVAQSSSPKKEKRPVTVADAIRMTTLADESYFKGGSSKGRVAHFSPDGEQFVVVLRKGKLEQNTNEYSLLLYGSKAAFRAPKPTLLLTMSSFSNRDAIRNVNWLDDNETIVFLGENAGQSPQVYALDVKTKRLNQLTKHVSLLVNYAISGDGQKILFAAEPLPKKKINTETSRGAGMVITAQSLDSILAGDCYSYKPNLVEGAELFLKVEKEAEKRIPVQDVIANDGFLSLSSNGRYGVFEAMVRDVPEDWREYQDESVSESFNEKRLKGAASTISRYILVDTESRTTRPLLNAPETGGAPKWRPDSQAILVPQTLLPLNVPDPAEREARKKNRYNVQVNLISGEISKLTEEDSPEGYTVSQRFGVTLEENINTPPRIYVTDLKTEQKSLVLDLNPQFADLDFGKVESVSWKATDGHEVVGGLYFPRDFDPQKRYPLVIQTHGFNPERFWIDGPWSSAFAAQPLASAGFVVLQVGVAKDGDEAKYVNTEMEGPRAMAAYEGAISYLDARGIVDCDRVGVIGFSRTVFTVGYTLTHSKYRFSTATLVDGIDAGYFQYIAFSSSFAALSEEFEQINGGPPWGNSLATWIKTAPGFNMDKINTPLRLVALGPASVLEMWEWFSGLSRLQKPVDFMYLPNAPHLIVKPSDRMVAQQGLVDWFRFWLKSEEDSDPVKGEQYARWRALRKLQEENEAKMKTGAPN